MSQTCPWVIDVSCNQAAWDAADPAMQARATAFATDVLWAATGRQFSACQTTVRPCLRSGEWGWFLWYNNGWDTGGWGWVPFLFNGQWSNIAGCGCGAAGPFCCEPRWHTQALLQGPVASIVNVTIGALTLPNTSYRVDDHQWLVRTDGGTWPIEQDLNEDAGELSTWSVTYLRGTQVPTPLLAGAGTLAIEYIKACTNDSTCRLNGYVTSIIRNGVQMEMVNPATLLKQGLIGIREVDLLIAAYNPAGLKARLRVFSPDVEVNRETTWQAP